MKPYRYYFKENDTTIRIMANDWLEEYTKNPWDKNISEKSQKALLDMYGADKDMKLYRGINFSTEEEYNNFMKATNNMSNYSISGIDSFSPDIKIAERFAKTRPMYMDAMDKSDLKDLAGRLKVRDRYSGYKGVIIGVRAKASQIIDVGKSQFQKERECLLTKGTYRIIHAKELKQYRDVTDTDEKINKYLKKFSFKNYTKINEFKNVIDYILNKMDLPEYDKDSILEKINVKNINFDIRHNLGTKNYPYEKADVPNPDPRNYHLNLYFNFSIFDIIYLLDKIDTKNSLNLAQEIIDNFSKSLDSYLLKNNLYKYDWNPDQSTVLWSFDTFDKELGFDISLLNKIRNKFKNPVKSRSYTFAPNKKRNN